MNISIVQSMISAIENPAIFINTEYKILAVNQAYRDTYDIQVTLGNSHCYEISHQHQQPCEKHGEECPMQQCMKTGRTSSVVHIHNTERGKTYCDILMKPIKDEDGITAGFLEILNRINYASAESHANRMIGSSAPFKAMLTKINRAAKSEISALLHGETGTGKELVAKALHESSKRADKPFVIIECTGLNDNLFESELFGHEKGAFTGATHVKKGLIEIANGGTVFFDEIADVPLAMQVKLLRLLETQCYRTVGGVKQHKADFRLICASHHNLLDLVQEGRFRKDLYYRIAGFPITLPSLATRHEDIPALARHFLNDSEFCHKTFSNKALEKLSRYPFPGNIRELKNIVEQSALLANEDMINVEDIPEYIFEENTKRIVATKELVTIDQAEKTYLTQICETQSLPIDKLAKKLGVSTRTLYRKLKKYELKYE
ncbi:sigma-54-dependent Fis family transcriptional regulator [uncultured Paraglaciecola sp.]|uniref:sigma-54 interaction domain-containing protein n=1 Tax=uncultured Paraglaciecola sp. TaxID=1765024 RepID=UPI0025941086|nr:sigma-54-dependent Fis family transcriptional regulator [uncultured Paraglaciecola sp.]